MTSDDSTGKQKKQRLSTAAILAYFLGTAFATFILMVSVHRVILLLNQRGDSFDLSAIKLSNEQQIYPTVHPSPTIHHIDISTTRSTSTESSVQTLYEGTKVAKKIPFTTHTITKPDKPVDSDGPSAKETLSVKASSEAFTSIKNPVKQKFPKDSSIIPNSLICSADMLKRYSEIPNAEAIQSDLEWCQQAKARFGVQIGRSWGSLSGDGRFQWDEKKCNELLALGKLQACNERWGWGYYDNWMNNTFDVLIGGSRVTCMVDVKTTTYCKMSNVTIDFSKARVEGQSRSFRQGFLNLFGIPTVKYGKIPPYPGIQHFDKEISPSMDDGQCDEIEERPTFVLSNDDIFNLGHYMNDVMGIWSMFSIANYYPSDSLLINMDGVRSGGPAGGPAHRLMLSQSPDNHGPYSEHYYHKWFSEVKKGIDYGQKRICYRSLYLFPLPGIPWFWNNWGRVDECSMISQSPLYQSFNVYLRQRIIDNFLASTATAGTSTMSMSQILPNPPLDKIHIVIEVRKINPQKRNNHSSSRYIANLVELVSAFSSLPNVKVTAQDFAQLSFIEQIKLAHSASIFVSMHGAGTTHIFHMAVGQKNCCGLLELFPDTSIELHAAQGYGNLARMLGLHHVRYVAERGNTKPGGTTVNVGLLKSIMANMTRNVARLPTCLLDVKDTRVPVYGDSRKVFDFEDTADLLKSRH